MDFSLSPEIEALRLKVRAFVEEHVLPLEKDPANFADNENIPHDRLEPVRVKARAIFPNCPRYIPKLELREPSPYTPQAGVEPVEPAWKGFEDFRDVVHPRQPTAKG